MAMTGNGRSMGAIGATAPDWLAPPRKKGKPASSSPPMIFTFGAAHSAVKIQLLSSHTVDDLCDTLCQHTQIAGGEGARGHMWNIRLGAGAGDEECYESGLRPCKSGLRAAETSLGELPLAVNGRLLLEYDYGSTSYYEIKLLAESGLGAESEQGFPRRAGAAAAAVAPPGVAKFSPSDPGVDLNSAFAALNEWAFVEGSGVVFNLFNPPRKHNHGYLERGNGGVQHMVLMPAAPPKDLAAYLHCLDESVGRQYLEDAVYGGPRSSWFSVVVLPAAAVTDRLWKKWGQDQEPGFVEVAEVAHPPGLPPLNKAFPKLAALAGFTKDAAVPKGWLAYQHSTLRICTGKSESPKADHAPGGTAFQGAGQHDPVDDSGVLFTVAVQVESLQALFCIAEGLLQSL